MAACLQRALGLRQPRCIWETLKDASSINNQKLNAPQIDWGNNLQVGCQPKLAFLDTLYHVHRVPSSRAILAEPSPTLLSPDLLLVEKENLHNSVWESLGTEEDLNPRQRCCSHHRNQTSFLSHPKCRMACEQCSKKNHLSDFTSGKRNPNKAKKE